MAKFSVNMLLFAVIYLALGNSLPIHCQRNEKAEAGEDNQFDGQLDENFIKEKFLAADSSNLRQLNIVPDTQTATSSFKTFRQSEIELLQKYFGNKDDSTISFCFVAKCFLLIYILMATIWRRRSQGPTALIAIGILTIAVKYST